MGPLYKFQGFPFADAPAEADGKAELRSIIADARLPPETRGNCSARNVEMLSLVGLGVAMGNAKPPARAAANVVVGTNDEDGVAEAVQSYVLDPHAAS